MTVEVVKTRMYKDVIESIIEVDKTFYTDIDYSSNDWYFDRYSDKSEVTVLKVDGVICGYFIFCGIKENLFKDICELKYDNDYYFSVNDMDVDSDIKYLASVLVKEEYRKFALPLIKELDNQFKLLNSVVAIAVSEEGRKMCERYMQKLGNVNNKADVYLKTKKQGT